MEPEVLLLEEDEPLFESPEIAQLYRYWDGKRRARGGTLPGRQAIDPVEIAGLRPSVLANVWLIDVVPPGPRFRIRLVGGALVDAGVNFNVGDFIDEIEDPASPLSITVDLTGGIEQRLPGYRVGAPILSHSKYTNRLERLCLPLAEDGSNVDMFLCGTFYFWKRF
jgi:hypothetical protein